MDEKPMSGTASCPHCQRTITLPEGVSPEDRFLCPLCQRGFNAGEAVPVPAAVPVNAPQRPKVEYVSDAEARRIAPSSQTLRRRSQPSNWFGQLIGIVGGGFIGLTIGYCILLRIRGADADFLKIADRLPSWATGLPPAQPPPDAEPAAEEMPSNDEQPHDEQPNH